MQLIAYGLSNALGSPCVECRRPGAALCRACAAKCRPCGVAEAVEKVDRVLAPWSYEDAARHLVLALKLRGRRDAAVPLVAAMAATVHSSGLQADVLTWVPGRTGDKRRRGFDHAELLARGLAARIGLPVVPLLRRVADPPDQTTLSREERRRNLAGAFEGTTPEPGRVAIIDDLVTTGATLTACAMALGTTRATGIEAVVACRA